MHVFRSNFKLIWNQFRIHLEWILNTFESILNQNDLELILNQYDSEFYTPRRLEKQLYLRDGFKNYLCTFCRKFYKGGGGGSAVLQALVRIFEKILKVLQMLQFIQK